ncbi:PEP-CTERM sorting domain-containing protein [Cerasicoccus fimbriatus]|uniref:PEP-CTERM sorting domain-containing protein n=1 Tax=Cerasicoccus fimbriatus TaxID=3014554 RepID=UPI0022B436AE|nr:PEP-CTERM sorting domain-containing protein [Cerasicoccus sp. TK19100]
MNKYLTPSTAILLFAVSASAQTNWTGSINNDFSTAGNWDNGLPDNATNPGIITSGTPTYDAITNGNLSSTNIIQSGGTASFFTDNQVTFQNDSVWDLNGGTIDISGTGRLSLGGTATLNVNGGNLTSSGGGIFWVNSSNANLSILQDLNTSVILSQRTGNVLIDNSTLTIGTYNFSNNTSLAALTLQNGGTLNATTIFDYAGGNNTNQGQITFTNGANSLQAAAWDRPAEMQFDFTSTAVGSTITITTGFYNQTEWETKWTDGELTVDGANLGSFSDYFTVSGDTLTMVPEPSTYALLGGLMAIGLALLRRRK